MENPSLGEQELEVLQFVSEHAPVTAREVVVGFGEERSLARTTVLTVIERLRKKGYLTRKRREGAFRYSPCVPQAQLLQNLVSRFVERTLGGSVSPVVAYLADAKRMSEADLAELEKLVNELKAEKESEG